MGGRELRDPKDVPKHPTLLGLTCPQSRKKIPQSSTACLPGSLESHGTWHGPAPSPTTCKQGLSFLTCKMRAMTRPASNSWRVGRKRRRAGHAVSRTWPWASPARIPARSSPL